MKQIFALVALVALVSMSAAFPLDAVNDSSVFKIVIDTGNSMTGIFAWQNVTTGQWEVFMGAQTYKGSSVLPEIYYGDRDGIVSVDLT